MKAARCTNGHWYDADTYDKCPHCGETIKGSADSVESNVKQKEKKSRLGFLGKKKEPFKSSTQSTEKQTSQKNTVGGKSAAVSVSTQDEVTERFFSELDDEDKTMAMIIPNNGTEVSSESSVMESRRVETENSGGSGNAVAKKQTSEPLLEAVHRVSVMDEGKTLSYFNAISNQSAKTEPESATIEKKTDPVVGWLVCVSGAHFGESFQIYAGRNTMGRSTNNKIVFGLDKSISRETHATIIYEPKKREFFVQAGTSEGLIYVNESLVASSEIIKHKDTLEIGSLKLILIPLCGTDFSWEQYL